MTVTILPRLPMTKAIRAALQATMGDDKPVGLGAIPWVLDPSPSAPANAKILAKAPYAVLYPQQATFSGPPFSAPDADARWVYQVTLAADRTDVLEWMRDRTFKLFLERGPHPVLFTTPFLAVGMRNTDRDMLEDTGIPEESELPITSDLRFAVSCTPA